MYWHCWRPVRPKKGRKKGHKKAKNGIYIILLEQQVQHHKNVNDILQNLLRIIKLDAPTSLKAREAEKGCKKAKNGSYIIFITCESAKIKVTWNYNCGFIINYLVNA